jgi:uncharacterized protein (DUF697 family)
MTTEQKNAAALAKDGNKVIRNHMLVSMGVGLIPIPMADLVGITAVQLNMLRKLAKLHEVPFTQHKVKSILTALVGGGGSVPVAEGFASLVKFIPVVGTTVGAVSMPITAGAVTYAVGKVFLQHFASGGTFLTFDPEKVRDYYAEMFKEGKTAAATDMAS